MHAIMMEMVNGNQKLDNKIENSQQFRKQKVKTSISQYTSVTLS